MKDAEFKVAYMKPQKSYLILRNHPAVTLVKESAERILGYTPKFKVESGRTDSTYLSEAGIKTVIIGPGEVAHVADEYVDIKEFQAFTEVLSHLLSPDKAA